MTDPAARPQPGNSTPAARGDICVLFHPSGVYGIGKVTRIDQAGAVVTVDCGGSHFEATHLGRAVEPRSTFDINVHHVFGWCKTLDHVRDRLQQHIKRPILPLKSSESRTA